ncbi:alanine dehydrogenase [Siphonobacter aquaeclarae]|jgi:alanine dehydrogenase|uniref:alanine dehydrogenase n=1 Tax=Siphonobacter aquaeclarae TaxID=563176 RepID=A0A1G9PJV9_9BACT|nr:alanine dehydrogenase [Siphonobacter aquaeclarae]MBO9637974.1 alanine dehydrogenase [Siphonobacter aquaeclarae]SDL98994.1 alanine dehydrogenase [Siphonobacter aquaeclarae]
MSVPQVQQSDFESLAQQTLLYPQEQLAPVKNQRHSLQIGLPKEVSFLDNRIALVPEAVRLLVRNGHHIVVESGAGEGAQFTDHDYREAGARIVYSPEEAYAADVILKVEPVTEAEYRYLRRGSTLISALTIPNRTQEYFSALNEKQVTAIAFEFIEDKSGAMPIIRTMSEIAGSTVMMIAAEYLSGVHQGKGIILGGITGVPPTKVVIVGAGTVAEYAARMALGLGAQVQVFDKDMYRLQRLRYAVGQPIYTSVIHTEQLADAVQQADVVIGAMRGEEGRSPMIVTEEMVTRMRTSSVIIDVSIDQGGNVETSEMTTHRQPMFRKHGVIHYCVPNIASRVAHTASIALSNVFTPFLLQTGTLGGIEEMMFANKWFMKGVYCHNGSITNAHIARLFNLRYKDLGLLLAARR